MDREEQNHAYDDIIGLPHPTSRNHPRMSPENRAAQFSPFAALTGHEEAVRETARRTEERQELSEDAAACLNEKLMMVRENIGARQPVTITWFVPDEKKSGGAYISRSGVVQAIDEYKRELVLQDGTKIPIGQISDMEGSMFSVLDMWS